MRHTPWSAIHDFKYEVQRARRSIFSDKTNQFLQGIRKGLAKREKIEPKGTLLFRSQAGYEENHHEDYPEYCGHDAERMKPISGLAIEGRSNPKGIPVLYLSSDEITSMSELRPQVAQIISCGQFVTNRELKLVDCCTVGKNYTETQLYFSSPDSEEEWDDQLWFQLNKLFSQPVLNEPHNALYVPTQILSELFNHEGFDGLYFKSHLGPGINYVIFEPANVDMKNCALKYTKKVEYSFDEFDPRTHL